MRDRSHPRFERDNLILRGALAVDRTLLANERTLLAYLRSAVALVIAGVSIMHFARQDWFWDVGVACIPSGITAGIIGVLRYRRMKRAIDSVRHKAAPPGWPAPDDRSPDLPEPGSDRHHVA